MVPGTIVRLKLQNAAVSDMVLNGKRPISSTTVPPPTGPSVGCKRATLAAGATMKTIASSQVRTPPSCPETRTEVSEGARDLGDMHPIRSCDNRRGSRAVPSNLHRTPDGEIPTPCSMTVVPPAVGPERGESLRT